MVKINKHIEIVRSSTPSLSSMGQKSCDMLCTVLRKRYTQVDVTTVNNRYDLELLVAKQPDLAFLGMKMIPLSESSSDKLWLSDFLDERGINFTGSTADAIGLDFDKPAAKRVIARANLLTADHFTASPGQYTATEQLPFGFPLFVKPPNGGGGKGIGADSVIRNFAAFEAKVAMVANKFMVDALVEKYLPGREFSVAILETANIDEPLVMPIELITVENENGDRILGQTIKAADTEHTIAVLDQVVKEQVSDLALRAFRALGARDYGRIDIRLDAYGTPHFLEANLIPGLAFHDFTSYFTGACWINEAMDYETMLLRIAEISLARTAEVNEFMHATPIFEISPVSA